MGQVLTAASGADSVGPRNATVLIGSLALFSIAAPLTVYALFVAAFAVNRPVGDDYLAVFQFLDSYLLADTWSDRMVLLFSQHNEHRIALTRAVVLLDYYVFGAVNFRHLLFVGNLAVVLLVGLLAWVFRPQSKWKLLLFLPVPLLLLQPQSLKNMFYPMASLQNFYVVVFAVGYLILLERRSWLSFGSSMLAYTAAAFTSGSGPFLVLIGALLLGIQQRFREITAHLFLAAFVFYVYFAGYTTPHHDTVHLDTLFTNADKIVLFFLHNLGSSAQIGTLGPRYTLLLGMGLLGFWVYLVVTGDHRRNLVLFAIFLFVLMSLGLIAINRATLYEDRIVMMAMDGRYRIYSTLFLALAMLAIAQRVSERKAAIVAAGLLGISVAFNVTCYLDNLGDARVMREMRLEGLAKWQETADNTKLSPRQEAAPLTRLAISKGYYAPLKRTR